MMGIVRLLIGFYFGWLVIKTARRYLVGSLAQSNANETKLKDQPVKTLELMPCPSCGVYTTAPCTNPDCVKN